MRGSERSSVTHGNGEYEDYHPVTGIFMFESWASLAWYFFNCITPGMINKYLLKVHDWANGDRISVHCDEVNPSGYVNKTGHMIFETASSRHDISHSIKPEYDDVEDIPDQLNILGEILPAVLCDMVIDYLIDWPLMNQLYDTDYHITGNCTITDLIGTVTSDI